MIPISSIFALFALLLTSAAAQPSSLASASQQKKPDICALLTSSEIEAVQGEPVKEAKASAQPSGGMLISQCLFLTPTSAKSVNLSVTTPDSGGSITPREFWRSQFHSASHKKTEEDYGKSKPESEREEASNPHFISGIAEEAYWVGSSIAGALYVLKGESFLRISVGGFSDESARLEKAKALARAAIKRF